MARRVVEATATEPGLVEYASSEPSAFAEMLGGLIEANVLANSQKKKDFDTLVARVGFWVTDIDEGVTLVFNAGALTVYNGLEAGRTITIRAEAETVLSLSNLEDRSLRTARLLRRRGQRRRAQATPGQVADRRAATQHRNPEPRDQDLFCSVIAKPNPPSLTLPGKRGGQ